jgi:hypothetical protein
MFLELHRPALSRFLSDSVPMPLCVDLPDVASVFHVESLKAGPQTDMTLAHGIFLLSSLSFSLSFLSPYSAHTSVLWQTET